MEQHKDGWPHVNVLAHLPDFVAATNDNWRRVRRLVNAAALRCGCGLHFWLESVKSHEKIAGYFVKLCHEVAKTTQAPVEAPPRFRRLRSSRGLLAPVHKNPDITGLLMQFSRDLIEKAMERPWLAVSGEVPLGKKFLNAYTPRFQRNLLQKNMEFLDLKNYVPLDSGYLEAVDRFRKWLVGEVSGYDEKEVYRSEKACSCEIFTEREG